MRRTEDAATRAAHILTVDEKSWVAAGYLRQGLVDRIEHTDGARGTGRLDGGFFGEAIHVLQVTVRAGQWLPLHLLINLGDLCSGLFFEPINVLFGQQPHLNETVAGIDNRIACLLGLLDLVTRAIRIDVSAAGVRVEQPHLEMQQSRAFGTYMLGQRGRGFIEGNCVAAVHLDGFGSTTACPFDQAPTPLSV